MSIPQYKPTYTAEDKKKLHELVDSDTWFAEFKNVEDFEKELAFVTENKYAIAVNNGTFAISIVLSALGIRPYDQVIVPDLTMVATANAVRFIGATPVLGDIDPANGCLDVDKAIQLAELVGARAIVYVTLNGRMDYNGIIKLKKYCDENSIWLIKDDAQSLGSRTLHGNMSLQSPEFADVHTLSFSPHKIVSCGQGGAIVTSSDRLYEKFKRMKDFGRLSGGADIHDYFGINSKFTELQACLGLSQLKRINEIIKYKHLIYDTYFKFLDGSGAKMIKDHVRTVPWFVDIYVENRDQLFLDLKEQGIGTRKLYPALHTQACYDLRENVHEDCKPVESSIFSNKGLWLPSSFDLTEEDIKNICDKIKESIK